MASTSTFDLLSTVTAGGCSAKLPPKVLSEMLQGLPKITDPNLMVDIDTHDDAGVYRLNDTTALIYTTDFFPPVCSDAFEFGEIAAANALSDVYAMGGTPLMCLNLMMFSTAKLPKESFTDIIQGGLAKVTEAGALIVGGHTIEDHPPKYGLAVVGTIHPDNLITNAGAQSGDILVLTKPIGSGIAAAARREDMISEEAYRASIENMKLLNKVGAELMQKHGAHAATDVTGFGLAGHALKLAEASKVTIELNLTHIPLLPEVESIVDDGCIPNAVFRNKDFAECSDAVISKEFYNRYLLTFDAQTSGGLFIAVPPESAEALVTDLIESGLHPDAAIIGSVKDQGTQPLIFSA